MMLYFFYTEIVRFISKNMLTFAIFVVLCASGEWKNVGNQTDVGSQ